MSNQDPYLKPLSNLAKFRFQKKDAWLFIFYNLVHNLAVDTFLLDFYEHSILKDFFSSRIKEEKFIEMGDQVSFSLDEKDSETHLTPYHLSVLYQSFANKSSLGQVYTPGYISEYIAMNSLFYFLSNSNKLSLKNSKVADIVCGTGNLIIPLLQQLSEKFEEKQLNSNIQFPDYIERNLFCSDLDPSALQICKLRVLFFLIFKYEITKLPDISNNYSCGNSLLDKNLIDNSKNAFDQNVSFISTIKKKESKFDIIVSNPPYMCYGLRNAQEYKEEYKNYLRENYKSSEYKLSMYPLFIERCLNLLNEEGILGIITPDTYLLGRYYSKARSFILYHSIIKQIAILGFEAFRYVTLGRPTLSFFQRKKEPSKVSETESFQTKWFPFRKSFEDESYNEYVSYQREFYTNPVNRFHLYFSKEERDFIRKWNESSVVSVKDIATMHTGIRSKIGQKNIVSKSKEGRTWKKGIISSSQVVPFYTSYNGDWINVDSSILWSGGFKKEIIENPKIFIRQTGYNISTAVDTSKYYHLNNVHSLSPKTRICNLYALATIFNSEEFNNSYWILSMERWRALAQVDIDFFLNLTIPIFEREDYVKLEEFYIEQQEIWEKGSEVKSFKLEEVLERKIFDQ